MGLCLVGSSKGIDGVRDLAGTIDSRDSEYGASVPDLANVEEAAKKAGNGGSIVLGSVGAGAAAAIKKFLGLGLNVLSCDLLSCSSNEWAALEEVAKKRRLRLLCGAQAPRFSEKLCCRTPEPGGAVRIDMYGMGNGSDAERALATPADIAMLLQGSAPQALFASAGGGKGGAPHCCSAMMRFEGGASALIASSRQVSGDERGARLEVGMHSSNAAHIASIAYDGAQRAPPEEAMLQYLLDGALPAFAVTPQARQSIEQLCCSRISRVMEAVFVSINTGAPVYIQT